MLYWKYSANRIFFLNEYWVLIPVALVSNYFIIRKIKCRRKQLKQLKELQKLVQRYKERQKLDRICHVAFGLSAGSLCGLSAAALILSGRLRGGDLVNVVDVNYLDCSIEEGIRYLDNDRIRKIIIDLYSKKMKKRIIFITSTAACYLSQRYGTTFLALPIAMGDFGLTNLYQTLRKLGVVVLLGTAATVYMIGNPLALFIASMMATTGLNLAFINLDKLPTTMVDETIPINQIKPRIADLPDVLIVNHRNKIKAPDIVPPKKECWLPEQSYFNPNCRIKTTEIPTAVNLAQRELKYDNIVNMKDVTNLSRVDFSDIFDLGKPQTSISKATKGISKATKGIPKATKGKVVNFLELFGDPAEIPESETWDIDDAVDTVAKIQNSLKEEL